MTVRRQPVMVLSLGQRSMVVGSLTKCKKKSTAVSVQSPFLLEKDVKPDKVTLILVARGERTV